MILSRINLEKKAHKEAPSTKTSLRERRLRTTAFAISIIATGALISAPLAQAVVRTYVNADTMENVYRYSGTVSSIRGGNATLEPFSADGAGTHLFLESYYAAPGYRTILAVRGGSSVSMSHPSSANAQQKCRWDWPFHHKDNLKLHLRCATN